MNRANMGVLVPAGAWITMPNFTTGTVLMCIASEEYEEEDYIRDYDEYLRYVQALPEGERPVVAL